MPVIRIVFDGFRPAAWNMAYDEALLNSCVRHGSATLRVYGFSPGAVTLGRFRPLSDVDLGAAERLRVDVVRRPSGGGTVFHDELGEVTYCVAVPLSWVGVAENLFRRVCGSLAARLREMGLPATYKELNDVLIRGRKVSGSAQLVRGGCVMQHGTLMYATRLDVLRRLLPGAKNVTTLEAELGRRVSYGEALGVVVDAVTRGLGVEAREGGYSFEEALEAYRIFHVNKNRVVPGKRV